MTGTHLHDETRIKLRATLVTILLLLVGAVSLATDARAAFQIEAFDHQVSNADGDAETRAAAHPFDVTTSFDLGPRFTDPLLGAPQPEEQVRRVTVDLPPGFVGNPTVLPTCTRTDVLGGGNAGSTCQLDTQVGLVAIETGLGRSWAPLYNVEPGHGEPATFGFNYNGTPVLMSARLRSDGDYGISVESRNISQAAPILGVAVRFWGAPGDPAHDAFRHGFTGTTRMSCLDPGVLGHTPGSFGSFCHVDGPPKAFLTNPTACTVSGDGLETRLSAVSWNGTPATAASISHEPPGYPEPAPWGPVVGIVGCEDVPFDAEIAADPTTSEPDAPTGLRLTLTMPQDGVTDPAQLGNAHLRRARVTLPEGMTINPAAADGLLACSDADARIGSLDPMVCPQGAKIGSAEAITPLLDEPLVGAVYVGTQNSDDPASGKMFRLFLHLGDEERGIDVRLPGQLRADPISGRLEATFDDSPQLPLERLELSFKDGPRAALAMPPTCGEKTVEAELTSWSGATITRSDSFTVDCSPGLGAFAPAFEAGSIDPAGGAFSPFALRIDRAPRNATLAGVAVDMPQGLLARVAGNVGARVGTARVAAGAGSNPFWFSGPVVLEGPYDDAPFSLRVTVPAKAGPYDLGDVVVRQKIYIDPTTAQVRIVSDPLPTIVKGVPVRLRTLHVEIDRPRFMLNPSNCSPKSIGAKLSSDSGVQASSRSRFQVTRCAELPFKPRLGLMLTGRRQLGSGRHPGLRAVVRQAGVRESRIARAVVALPKALALDPNNARGLCEFDDGVKPDLERRCPSSSIVGRAKVHTPLLDEPLVGNVYFVKNVRLDLDTGSRIRTLPMLVAALRGEIDINLTGTSSVRRGKLVSTFAAVPDAPVSRFHLRLHGGRHGILVVTENRLGRIHLCSSRRTAQVNMRGHNGKSDAYAVSVKTPCAKKRSARRGKR